MQQIDSLIKVGGSLIGKNKNFYDLVETLENTSKDKKIILTTGSKDISDIIRDRLLDIIESDLSLENHIDITWKSRDIMSQVFCDISDKFVPAFDLQEIDSILKSDRIPVVIQYELLKQLQPFPLTRGLSTDTSSLFFASYFNTNRFIKLTDVDGVFENMEDDTSLLQKVTTDKLRNMGRTCICEAMAGFLDKVNGICYVLNGNNSGNLKNFLEDGDAVYTKVFSNNCL